MIHLRAITPKPDAPARRGFPFSLPLVQNLTEIEFNAPVTFFVGENGSGKSTLLEAIAAGVEAVVVGGEDIARDPTLQHARNLAKALKFVWRNRTRRGFFLRAEDFFSFTKRINALNAELEREARAFEEEGLTGHALGLAQGAVLGQRRALVEKYGEDADARSHGESFLHLFQERVTPGGLYLLDEPEAALSPQRQLTLLSILKEEVGRDSQFIIATHSPLLLAFPDAQIFSFDGGAMQPAAYEELEHVTLTRAFLANPQNFLRRL
jgi:predicted ATPase